MNPMPTATSDSALKQASEPASPAVTETKVSPEIVQGLKTREQKFKEGRWDRMFVSKSVITSQAFMALRTPAACKVYLIFLTKCQYKQAEGKRKRENNFIHVNNGKIQFTYKEAKDKYGLSDGMFKRAIDELIRVGLIDIAKSGLGLHKDVTLYSISERWKAFKTGYFVTKERQKRAGLGFRKGNKHGKNCEGETI